MNFWEWLDRNKVWLSNNAPGLTFIFVFAFTPFMILLGWFILKLVGKV